ncbi:hypothetical protein Avbf_05964 [Armadillidium vulgare]|nr:hypothetical protein Avbf_05964 [Armadillidium vulgare]
MEKHKISDIALLRSIFSHPIEYNNVTHVQISSHLNAISMFTSTSSSYSGFQYIASAMGILVYKCLYAQDGLGSVKTSNAFKVPSPQKNQVKCDPRNRFGNYDSYWSNKCTDIITACNVGPQCFAASSSEAFVIEKWTTVIPKIHRTTFKTRKNRRRRRILYRVRGQNVL